MVHVDLLLVVEVDPVERQRPLDRTELRTVPVVGDDPCELLEQLVNAEADRLQVSDRRLTQALLEVRVLGERVADLADRSFDTGCACRPGVAEGAVLRERLEDGGALVVGDLDLRYLAGEFVGHGSPQDVYGCRDVAAAA